MTDDTPAKDDPFAMDELPTHRFVAGGAGTGKTTLLIEQLSGENAPKWFDPKADDVDGPDGGDS